MKEWHTTAIEMKKGGLSLKEIGRRLGYTLGAVQFATKTVKSPKTMGQHISEAKMGKPQPHKRAKHREAGGFKMGTYNRIAVNFTDEQFQFLVSEGERLQISLSKTVSDIVQSSLLSQTKGK